MNLKQTKLLIRTAQGLEAADVYIKGCQVVNVYSGEILEANVAVKGDSIAYVGTSETMLGSATELIDGKGYYLVPGYIEPHAHNGIYNPVNFCQTILARGVTGVVLDTLFLAQHHLGAKQTSDFMESLNRLPLRIFWGLRTDAPTVNPREEELFPLRDMECFLRGNQVSTICEMVSWQDVSQGDERLLGYLLLARDKGIPVDLHSAGASGEKLQALVAAGASDCHESINVQQALERLRLGEYVMLRNSAVRQDLKELLKVVTDHQAYTARMMFTTDGPTPGFLWREGSIDSMVATAINEGVDPVTAYRMATLNPANYLRIDYRLGGIAPGKLADILFLTSLEDATPEKVMVGGQVVVDKDRLLVDFPKVNWPQLGLGLLDGELPPEGLFMPPSLKLPVIRLTTGVLTRKSEIESTEVSEVIAQKEDLLFLTLFDAEDRWIVDGLVEGFATKSLEAMASSYTLTGKQGILTIGRNYHSMRQAAARVLELGGGIVVWEQGKPLFELELELKGLMSDAPMEQLAAKQGQLTAIMRQRGYKHGDIFYSLLFLMADFLPDIRITPAGIFDCRERKVLNRPRYY